MAFPRFAFTQPSNPRLPPNHCLYVCGIESSVLEAFEYEVCKIINRAQIIFYHYIGIGKENWRFAQILVEERNQVIQLNINLRGIKVGKSKLGLTVYLPPELPLNIRNGMEKIVYDQMKALGLRRSGCMYDTETQNRINEVKEAKKAFSDDELKELTELRTLVRVINIPEAIAQIELMHIFSQVGRVDDLIRARSGEVIVVYRRQWGAVMAMLCLNKYNIIKGKRITLEIHEKPNIVTLINKVICSVQQKLKSNRRDQWLLATKTRRWTRDSSLSSIQSGDLRKDKSTDFVNKSNVFQVSGDNNNTENTEKSKDCNSKTQENSQDDKLTTMKVKPQSAEEYREANSQFPVVSPTDNIDSRISDPIKSESMNKGLRVKLEIELSTAAHFLIQETKLEESLQQYGYDVYFQYIHIEGNFRLIVHMPSKDQGYIGKMLSSYTNCIISNSSQNLPHPLSTFIARHDEKQVLTNKHLRFNGIKAGIMRHGDSLSVSVVALDAKAHHLAISLLREMFCCQSTTVNVDGLFVRSDFHIFMHGLRNHLAGNYDIYLESVYSNNFDSCKILVAGKRADVSNATHIIQNHLDKYKVVEYVIPHVHLINAINQQLYWREDLQLLEKAYGCNIQIEKTTNKEANILIKCSQVYATNIYQKMEELIQRSSEVEISEVLNKKITLKNISGRNFEMDRTQDKHENLITALPNECERKLCIATASYNIKESINQNRANEGGSETKFESEIGQNMVDGKVNLDTLQDEKESTFILTCDDCNKITYCQEGTNSKTTENPSQVNPAVHVSSLSSATNDHDKISKIIKLVKGKVEKEGIEAQAIVNYVKLEKHHKGEIGKALHRLGGFQYQLDYYQNLQRLTVDEIGITKGTYFGCKKVYHIRFLSSNQPISWLIDRIKKCLEKAHSDSINSIAIPMYGSPEFSTNIDELSQEMVKGLLLEKFELQKIKS
ncbi:uncharacterized protein TRIADDRAFT_58771 [Trichoplax adhaerens]|uniref:RRM domain-containing protein n=1 Tax=Trichoplax adhaerens TaxID=10228 RepID=B3S3L9_TRIAD|nr:hypothetical protein TRIADDRAFT_58771 [Trichoplax adhaerens]EDV22824.1 hypothetical protein TRIADDRAFT_58771 [Trichoplax adhaerens]|eukprot:XP_002114690.1 hypothetical protein TRIADDRAFT_58771 [Trichoplax adhaerens]